MKKIFIFLVLIISVNILHARRIHLCARNNDVAGILELKQFKDQVDEYGYKPIHYAAQCDQLNALKALISVGANVHSITLKEGATALHLGAQFGGQGMIYCLLSHGADINAQDKVSSATPIHYAIYTNNITTFRILLICDQFKFDKVDIYGRTALHWAVMNCRPLMVKELLSYMRENQIQDRPDLSGYTALHMAQQYLADVTPYIDQDMNYRNRYIALTDIITLFTAENGVVQDAQASSSSSLPIIQHRIKSKSKTPVKTVKSIRSEQTAKEPVTVKPQASSFNTPAEYGYLNAFKRGMGKEDKDNPVTVCASAASRSNLTSSSSSMVKARSAKTLEEPFDDASDFDPVVQPSLAAMSDMVSDQQYRSSEQERKEEDEWQQVAGKKKNKQRAQADIAASTMQTNTQKEDDVADTASQASVVSQVEEEHKDDQADNSASVPVKKKKNKKKNLTGGAALIRAIISKADDIDDLITFDSVNEPDERGSLPLQVAVQKKSKHLRAILETGANVNAPDAQACRALSYAKNVETIDLLLEFNANISLLDEKLQQKIIGLANNKENQKFKHLRKLSTDANQLTFSSTFKLLDAKTVVAFFKAVKEGDLDSVYRIHQKYPNIITVIDEDERLPIHHAAMSYKFDPQAGMVMEYLLSQDTFSLFENDKNQQTAFDLMCITSNPYVVEYIIEKIGTNKALQRLAYIIPKINERLSQEAGKNLAKMERLQIK